jgi:phosphopantothenoylcysteine decarboxylase/phosphopantothenate--cysteine ligase
MSKSESKTKILILMSGSIACYKICYLISLLKKNNYDVKVAASQSALKFVGEATLEGLSGNPAATDLWQKGSAMEHIYLERWADLILAAPATSHLINRLANGIGDDLLTSLFLAHEFKKPFLLAPAMNTAMYLNPATQKSISELKKWGLSILEAASGVLACGETGYGKLLDPELLFQEISAALKQPNSKNAGSATLLNSTSLPKILVTAGGTEEPIDDVRRLTNSSTGRTGESLANYFAELGFDVTLLLSQTSNVKVKEIYQTFRFSTSQSLSDLLKQQLQTHFYHFVFHTAAVSDFTVEKSVGKLGSDQDLVLNLRRAPKLINSIKQWSQNSKLKLVGFKLTSGLTDSEVQSKIDKLKSQSQADFVVQNDIHQLQDRNNHEFQIFSNSIGSKKVVGTENLAQYFSVKIGESL